MYSYSGRSDHRTLHMRSVPDNIQHYFGVNIPDLYSFAPTHPQFVPIMGGLEACFIKYTNVLGVLLDLYYYKSYFQIAFLLHIQ